MSAGRRADQHAETIMNIYRGHFHPNPVTDGQLQLLSGLTPDQYRDGKIALREGLEDQEVWVYTAGGQGWCLTDDPVAQREMINRRARCGQTQIRRTAQSTVAPFRREDPDSTRRYLRLMDAAQEELEDLINRTGAP